MDLEEVLSFIQHVDRMKQPIRSYPGKTVVHLFSERSRSLYSFQAAATRLGCNTITIDQSMNETLEDAVRTVHHYGDLLVLKHSDTNSYTRAVSLSKIPVIQAGSYGELCQSLTDLYTLYKELEYRDIRLESTDREVLKITFMGYSRHVQPFVALLNLFPKIQFTYIHDMKQLEYGHDILYVSTPQCDENYCINREYLNRTKPTLVLLHPFPRQMEISTDVDTNPRSVYFKQVENSLYVKMAVLDKNLSIQTPPTLREQVCSLWGCLRSRLLFCR